MAPVRFLPALDSCVSPSSLVATDDLLQGPQGREKDVLPCLPLDGMLYVPDTRSITLTLSEPQYLEMMADLQREESMIAKTSSSRDAAKGKGKASDRLSGGRRAAGCFVATRIIRGEEDEDQKADEGAQEENSTVGALATPGGWQQLKRGALVRIMGLQGARELNGSLGKLMRFDTATGRWDVDIENNKCGAKALKPENLEPVPEETPCSKSSFKMWRTAADVGGHWYLAEVGVVLHLDSVVQDEPVSSTRMHQYGYGIDPRGRDVRTYKCTCSGVGRRARLRRILNPSAFARRSTYLRAEVEEFEDTDLGEQGILSVDEEVRTLRLMHEVSDLQESSGTQDVSVLLKAEALKKLDAMRGAGFWKAVGIWHAYLTARVQARKVRVNEKRLEELIQQLPLHTLERFHQKLADPAQTIQISDLPDELRKEFEMLHKSSPLSPAELEEIDFALPLQQILQADTEEERIWILQESILREKERLEVASQKTPLEILQGHEDVDGDSETLEEGDWEPFGQSFLKPRSNL